MKHIFAFCSQGVKLISFVVLPYMNMFDDIVHD